MLAENSTQNKFGQRTVRRGRARVVKGARVRTQKYRLVTRAHLSVCGNDVNAHTHVRPRSSLPPSMPISREGKILIAVGAKTFSNVHVYVVRHLQMLLGIEIGISISLCIL